jgi:multidrug efflux pump subunit AcrA (membrane-fusion protein)
VRPRDAWLLLAGSLAIALLLAGGAWFAWWKWKPAQIAAPPPAKAAETTKSEPRELSFSGTVQARHIISLPAPVEGTLESLEVQQGQEVFEEQLLGRVKNLSLEAEREASRLDAESAQDKVSQAESALIAARLEASRTAADADRARSQHAAAERAAQRQRMLYNEGATPRVAYERSQAELETSRTEAEAVTELARLAELRVQSAQQDLEASKKALDAKLAVLEDSTLDMQAAEIRSPVDGVVTGIRVQQGGEVSPAMTDLLQIAVNPGELFVPIEPNPDERKRLRPGMDASVQILELSSQTLDGKVVITEAGACRVEFDAGESVIRPGLSAVVKIRLP